MAKRGLISRSLKDLGIIAESAGATGTSTQVLVRTAIRIERHITRALRPTCTSCGGRMVFGARRGRGLGGPTRDEQANDWKLRATSAEEDVRLALEGSAAWADKATAAQAHVEELEAALVAAGRPGRQGAVMADMRRFLLRIVRPECPSCHRDIELALPHRANCQLAALLNKLDSITTPREPRRKKDEPPPGVPFLSPEPRARREAFEETRAGKIIAAVKAGSLPPEFTVAQVAKVLKLGRASVSSLLTLHAEGNPQGVTAHFVRLRPRVNVIGKKGAIEALYGLKEGAQAREVLVEDTPHGRIRAAVMAGELPKAFTAGMVNELLGIKHGSALLANNAAGNRSEGPEYFVRLKPGLYRLLEG